MIAPKIIIFSAPSGAGKTTIIRHLLKKKELRLEFSVSATSRPPRNGETHGEQYYFLSAEEFKQKIAENAFLEWEEVYNNQYYGTLRSEVERIWNKGNNIIFDIDVVGGLNVKKTFNDKTLAVFVQPPSIEDLKKRIRKRSSEDATSIKKRLSKATYELSFADQFDYILVNDSLDQTLLEAEKIVTDFIFEEKREI